MSYAGLNEQPQSINSHTPAQAWTYRVPSPPRILVPPPGLGANGAPHAPSMQNVSFDFERSGFSNYEFLQTVNHGNFVKSNSALDWKYGDRRKAQQVLPFLFLGPLSAAKEKDFLQKEGITLVIAVRNTLSAQTKLLDSRAAGELGLESQSIDVAGNQELIAAFPRGIEAINDHLTRMYGKQQREKTAFSVEGQASHLPGKVLVYCESGNDRSASLVVAYIMAMYSQDLIRALQMVQSHRFAVAFDDAMRNLLQSYESILQARRDVLQADVAISGSSTSSGEPVRGDWNGSLVRPKRSIGEAYDVDVDDGDEDMAMDGVHYDRGRFEKREGQAPFQDATNSRSSGAW